MIYFIIIFLFGLTLRLILLGQTPLVDSEASLAYQAWRISSGETVSLSSNVGYLSFTEMLFTIFGSSNILARIWPVLCGSLLILVPFLIREKIGDSTALILAGGLALDPALVSVSRMAGSVMPALVFSILALITMEKKQLPWVLFWSFMALFSGAGFWLGACILAITILVSDRFGLIETREYIKERLNPQRKNKELDHYNLEDFILPGAFILAIGSFFFSSPQGLSAWPGSMADFISGWQGFSRFRAVEVLIHLLVSNPLILIFGSLGFYSAWREGERLGKASSIWFGVALILLLVFPGRQPTDLVWLVVPLWYGTAAEFSRIYRFAENSWQVYVLAGIIAVLTFLNWQTFTGMIFQFGNQRAVLLQWGLIAASLALVVLALTYLASEWGWGLAKKGLAIGAGVMLFIYTFSAMVQGTYLMAGDPRSLWSDGSGAGQMNLLLDTIREISVSQTGRGDSIRGAVIQGDDSLKWALREMKGFEYLDSYHPADLPPILITSEEDQYLIPQETYQGQDFVIRTLPGWSGLIPDDWISWVAFRDAPVFTEKIVLWGLGDILAGEN
jgi:hypothetical protein